MDSSHANLTRRGFVKQAAASSTVLAVAPLLAHGYEQSAEAAEVRPAAYQLDLMFRGLYLFAIGSDNALHVLQPKTPGNAHELRAYSAGWPTKGISVAAGTRIKVDSTGTPAVLDFRDGMMDLSALSSSKLRKQDLVDTTSVSPELAGDIIVPTGILSSTDPWRSVWRVDDGSTLVVFSASVIWTTTIGSGDRDPLGLGHKVTLPTGSNARVELRYAPTSEQGPPPYPHVNEPAGGSEPPHADYFRSLFYPSLQSKFHYVGQVNPPKKRDDRSLTPFTCMAGGGT